ncbi:amidohydrolase [Sphingobium nicotianae]|uniref:Amidohydrolase n=1 Tax=Sphingobium nicotianae TaxID=2782607 RepID=A0A9X1ITF8_9SPHN|nr:amidohydrolase [Sphingobium nicotianae]MBT2189267.1 amidohydrolase [Sphingobium nicotianae]
MKISSLAFGLLLASAAPASAQLNGMLETLEPAPADTVLENGRIYTPNGWASAVAISKGTIVAVGDAGAVTPHKTASTRVIDLKGETVLPGLHDMHVHPAGAGIDQSRCSIPHGAAPAKVFEVTAACVAKAKPGEWVTGRAYEAASFGSTPPHKSMLDKVSPNNPVVFEDISGHSSWANSVALKAAGITRDTPDPKGGIIERDSKGEPTGILREAAGRLVRERVPPPSKKQYVSALKWALDLMASFGITSFVDAGLSTPGAIAYGELADKGELKQRVVGCIIYRENDLIAQRMFYSREKFSPTCIKIFVDGVPTDGHTAAMVDEYVPLVHGSETGREKGLLLIPQPELNAMVTRFDAMGMTMKFHAAGDAAVRAALNAIEVARKTNGFSGYYHNVGHNSFVKIEDIRRARSIEAAFEFSPYIWYPSPIIDDIRKAVGEERMKRWIPVKDALDAGALSVPGSDWSVVPSVNPWIAIETLVTRQVPGGGGEVLGAQERITLKQAIDMFTRASSRQMNMDAATGTIETGKLADLVVIDRDIFAIAPTEIHNTRVLRTFVGGEEIYTAPDAGSGR